MILSKLKIIGLAVGAIGLIASHLAIYAYGKQASESQWQAAKAEFAEQVKKEQKELYDSIMEVREAAFRRRLAQAREESIVEREVVRYVESEQESGSDNVCIADERGVQLYSDILGGRAAGTSDSE